MVCPGMLQNTYFIPLEGRGVENLNDGIFGVLTVLATYRKKTSALSIVTLLCRKVSKIGHQGTDVQATYQ